MKTNRTYCPCDECPYSYSRTGEESSMCKICELPYYISLVPKQGKWIERVEKLTWCEDDVEVYYDCSCCGAHNFDTFPYCPVCGAKMSFEEN